ncbi:MAG: hypothetical protein R3266_11645, partial [Gemmatimonadota bacterium]|nr:hypothetical protein [Gemmatimonadota bacterium]
GMSLPDALAAPRVHPRPGAAESNEASGLAVEAGVDDGWSPASLEVFEAFGLDIEPAAYRGAFGRVHGLAYDADTGVWTGAADPDWEGAAVAPRAVPASGRDGR